MKRASIAGPSQGVLDVFAAHAWPGNVRELEQVTRRIVIDSGALLDAGAASRALRDIAPSSAESSPAPVAIAETVSEELVSLDEAEKRHIIAVLRATGGNQTQAAYILGIERKTLARKIKRLDISLEP